MILKIAIADTNEVERKMSNVATEPKRSAIFTIVCMSKST